MRSRNFVLAVLVFKGGKVDDRPKRRKKMKCVKLFLFVLLLAGTLEISASSVWAAEVIINEAASSGDYCHLRFPAIREDTLYGASPVLQDPSRGDIIDFFGPCNHDPLGKEEVLTQRFQLEHRLFHDYTSD